MASSILTFTQYDEAAEKTAVYPGQGTVAGIVYCALKLAGEAGEVADNVGKSIRDDGLFDTRHIVSAMPSFSVKDMTPERREKLLYELGDAMWYISQMARELGSTMSQVAGMNVAKLQRRHDMGKIRGSGSDR